MKSAGQKLKKQLFIFSKPILLIMILTTGFFSLAGEEELPDGVNAYNSLDGGLEESGSGEDRIYPLERIEKLRRAISPRYIRVLDWLEDTHRSYLRKGILFTFESHRARNVMIAGNFNNWRPMPMKRNAAGVFYTIQPLQVREFGKKLGEYRYKYLVDGLWVSDRNNKNQESDGLGGTISSFHPGRPDLDRQISVHILEEPGDGKEQLVEFAIYLPDVENLSIVGNFNNWNPEHDFLRKGADGVFRIRKRLLPGRYLYKYVADGKWVLDTFNPDTRYLKDIDELCSYYEVED